MACSIIADPLINGWTGKESMRMHPDMKRVPIFVQTVLTVIIFSFTMKMRGPTTQAMTAGGGMTPCLSSTTKSQRSCLTM